MGFCILLLLLADMNPATRAYEALRAGDYDTAIALFREAIQAAPAQAALRKDLAYTYLKVGETEAARDEFAQAMQLDPPDERIALEYAFLCHETRRTAEARRIFDRLRKTGNATAAQAFDNIDRPLEEGIARWSAVVASAPDNFSARVELARLCEQRDELGPAANAYLAAWRLRPLERDLLVGAGRALLGLGRTAEATAALLAASRGGRPRAAEEARELLPRRYPYVAEFFSALELDPANVELRRELGFLLLEMGRKEEAEREFRSLAQQDLLSAAQLGFLLLERQDREGALAVLEPVLKSDDDELIARVRAALRLPAELRRRKPAEAAGEVGPKEMGERSYKAGYLRDALKYFQAAHEADPGDFSVMLRLGQTYNLLREDDQAVRWFDLARRNPDPEAAAEAARAYKNLRPQFARWRLTAWAFPFYSSRWRDLFSYGQVKADLRLGRLPLRPYLSLRFIGDTRRTTGEALPQYLSESSFLVAFGLATRYWHGAMLWAEAGSALRYTGAAERGGRMVPDYRGGVSFARGKGHLLGGEAGGWFAETHDDGVFVSRFDNDFLLYAQNQAGYTFGGRTLSAQLYWNGNLTADVKKQYWANFVELGPGLKVRWAPLPFVFSVNAVRGCYLRNSGNPQATVYTDVRAGFWYAATR